MCTSAYPLHYLTPDDQEPPSRPFSGSPGPTFPLSCHTPEDCFSRLIGGDQTWQFLVDYTNDYAARKIGPAPPKRTSLYHKWHPVTVEEMKAFVAVILNMGITQLSNLKDYWSTGDTTDLPFFRSVFSRNHFFQIFGVLHVGGDPSGTMKRDKIQPFLDELLPRFESAYSPPQQLAVDESAISFRGRVSFRQYLKGKPNPWGIKAYMLSGSKTGYMHNVLVCYGRETMLSRDDMPHTAAVVLMLTEGLGQGHDLYVDRFYSSPVLASELDKMGMTVTGKLALTYLSYHTSTRVLAYSGTVLSNRKGLPPELKGKKKGPRGSVESFRTGKLLALSWVDKRKVLMLSTKHSTGMVQVQSR